MTSADGYHDRVQNVNRLLHSMEADFLKVLADHHPKGRKDGASSDASSTGTSTDGSDDDEVELACFHLHASLEEVDSYLDAILRARVFGDRQALATVVALAEVMIRTLAEHGAELGWYDNDNDEED